MDRADNVISPPRRLHAQVDRRLPAGLFELTQILMVQNLVPQLPPAWVVNCENLYGYPAGCSESDYPFAIEFEVIGPRLATGVK